MIEHQQIVVASNNRGKLREISAILKPLDLRLQPQSEFDVPEAEETGLTFVENALLKARNACEYAQRPAIADDSGILVDALNGAPGIYSARYAGENASDQENNARLVSELQEVAHQDRTAHYYACIVYLRHAHDPEPIIAEGIWQGLIIDEPRGNGGFGYDPYFLLPELGKTAAELSAEDKNAISHRGQALMALLEKLKSR